MIERWQKSVDEGILSIAGGENELPDGIATFELALEALPEAERADLGAGPLIVEAISPSGDDWGTVVVGEQAAGGYVIESFSVNYEAGKICPPIE